MKPVCLRMYVGAVISLEATGKGTNLGREGLQLMTKMGLGETKTWNMRLVSGWGE